VQTSGRRAGCGRGGLLACGDLHIISGCVVWSVQQSACLSVGELAFGTGRSRGRRALPCDGHYPLRDTHFHLFPIICLVLTIDSGGGTPARRAVSVRRPYFFPFPLIVSILIGGGMGCRVRRAPLSKKNETPKQLLMLYHQKGNNKLIRTHNNSSIDAPRIKNIICLGTYKLV